ncbi:M20/M25/M40 family metallo-hydrolase [Telmatobacter sp. DSM 110680]|uniref:M20/M25/M40 family metallo-hydrolase n=1 Tax=Telmatobacter sp. DSM 110680 TaxID=3036704 RepID=A0AAU7DRJ2_9BACT
MWFARTVLLCGLALMCDAVCAQPDYALHAMPVGVPPADPAIARAIALIKPGQIHQTIEKLVSFGTRSTLSSMETDLPPREGINAAADWIAEEFESISRECGGCLEIKRDTFTADPGSASGSPWAGRIPKPTKITNVYAIQRGTDPAQSKRIVLVTGHYDSRNLNILDDHGAAPGANDDASGVAVSLECARALSKLKFPGTIVYAAVAGEEQGLVGSGHLAKVAKDEGWDLEAVLNNDIVGGNTTPDDPLQLKDRVRVFSEGVPVSAIPEEARKVRALGKEDDSPSRELARAIAETTRAYFSKQATAKPFSAFLVNRPDRYLRGGDHSSFNREGFAAVRFTEWREDYNHQHQNVTKPQSGSESPVLGDLIEFVDFNYVAAVARLNAATLATLAAAPGEPQKVIIVNKMTENGSTLTWEPPVGGGVAHYEVLWRETTAPSWQYVKQVAATASEGPVTVSLPVSKDNVIFGVRAVDAKGHRGLVVAP